VFNTIFNLVTQDEQVACFENAAAHLRSGGRFVIETGVPRLQDLPLGQTVIPFRADPEGISFDVYDVVTQRFSSQHFVLAEGRVETYPVELRYAWPSELDLMARIAGLTLQDRWAGWQREPFTSLSRAHISVYEKPGGHVFAPDAAGIEPALAVAACGPGDGLEREGRVRRKLPTPLFQLLALHGVEAGHVRTRGTDAERIRLPPIVETRVLHLDGQVGVLDVLETGGFEQLGKVARAGTCELRFVPSSGIELPNRRPKQAERAPPTGVVPDASGDHPARMGDPRHLAQSGDGIRHEMHNELREGNVELAIGKGQLLRGGKPDIDAGVALTGGDHKWLRGVDGRHRLGAESRYQLAG
jgi:hypothetical protein